MSPSALDLKLNYYALTIATLSPCRLELAFEKMQSDHPSAAEVEITEEDALDMKRLKQQRLTYKEIAEIYGISKHAAYYHIYRRKLSGGVCSAS